MAKPRSLLQTLLDSARRVLLLQVLLSLFAVALAGWTLSVTASLLRERAQLKDRVLQLEETMASRNIVVPPPQAVVEATPGYPPEVGAPQAAAGQNATQAIRDLFAPPPPLQTLAIHVRSQADIARATEVAAAASVEANINLMERDVRPAGYYYYDGRQSAAAAALVARFNDAAREAGLAPWSAQLRATALPARGEFAPGRLDIVLPALPPPPEPPPAPATGSQTP